MSQYMYGFTFNLIGDLVATPKRYTIQQLKELHGKLIREREYIRASRINHLINVEQGY